MKRHDSDLFCKEHGARVIDALMKNGIVFVPLIDDGVI